jgi:MoaE-MoaD fusion protein
MQGAEVTVLLFGPLRERVGIPEMHVQGGTVREVWQAVVRAHPAAARADRGVRPARNLSYCDWNSRVEMGDTIAFIPPVAGGSSDDDTPVSVAITADPIDVAAVVTGVGSRRDGAVASFVGTVRDHSDGHQVTRIDYEAYAEMAESEMRRIGEALYLRGGISAIVMVHRVGSVAVGEASVVIAVAAPHRDGAFPACQDAIEMIKRTVPVWKREHRDDGAHWVDARHGAQAKAFV